MVTHPLFWKQKLNSLEKQIVLPYTPWHQHLCLQGEHHRHPSARCPSNIEFLSLQSCSSVSWLYLVDPTGKTGKLDNTRSASQRPEGKWVSRLQLGNRRQIRVDALIAMTCNFFEEESKLIAPSSFVIVLNYNNLRWSVVIKLSPLESVVFL